MKHHKNKYKLLIGTIVISVTIMSLLFIITTKDETDKLSDQLIAVGSLKESPYTLDEIYEKIENNELYKCNIFEDDCQKLASVVFHFYDYFNKDTKFIVSSKNGDGIVPKEFKYISYSEYMDMIEKEEWDITIKSLEKEGKKSVIVPYAKLFISGFGTLS